jgi:dCTP deaminase
MGILCDTQIRELVGIEPFEDNVKRPGRISYGVSSYGYDVRVGTLFKIFTNVSPTGGQAIVDPKRFTDDLFVTVDTADTGKDHVIIPPNSFALCETVEEIAVPRDTLAICVGKSTYARCGIIVNVTPLEPEWEGHVTLEFSNTTPLPAKIYANEGAAQFLFLQGNEPCEVSYRDKAGKYQGQRGVTLPKI